MVQKRDRNIIGPGGGSSAAGSPTYDSATNSNRVTDVNQERFGAVKNSLVDTTNVVAGTVYYPSGDGKSMFGFKDLTLAGKIIDADGTITLTLETIDDEDLAAGDWIQVKGGYRADKDTTEDEITITNGTETFKWDFDNLNAGRYRVKAVFSGSTNTAIIKERVMP